MATAARLDLASRRNEARLFTMRIIGLDLTGVEMRQQVRGERDAPGTAIIDLGTVTSGNAEGIRLAGVVVEGGAPVSTITYRYNLTTMRDQLPYAGELGEDMRLVHAIQFDGVTRFYGDWWAVASAMDSDAAPLDRPNGSAFGCRAPAVLTGAAATFSDDVIEVTLGDAALLAPMVAQTSADRIATEAARDSALAAGRFRATKAAAEAAFPTVGGMIAYLVDGVITFAERTAGGSTVLPDLSQPLTKNTGVSKAGAETISGVKTFAGQQRFATNGSRIGITDSATPVAVPGALLHVVNTGSKTCAVRASSYWEGSTETPFVNNDNSLWETFNRVASDSANLSWSISSANAYNDIADGVTDTGQRVGVLGWAVSVHIPGQYEHHGTLEFQFGVRGRAGFQGPDNTGTVNNAIGVRGEIYNDSAGATIINGISGEFVSNASIGIVQNAYGIFAGAQNGTLKNYSVYGVAGVLFNQERIVSGIEFAETTAGFAARGTGPRIEWGFPGSGGYVSTLGSTVTTGRPYIGWNCEAHTSGDTYTTRGRAGYTAFTDSGILIFARVPNANAPNQAAVEAFRLGADGRAQFALGPIAPNYVVGGVQVVGPRGAAVPDAAVAAAAPTKAEFDALVGTINTLLARLRAHGLIA